MGIEGPILNCGSCLRIPRVLVSDSLPSYGSAFDAAIVPKARNQECRHSILTNDSDNGS